MQCWATVAVTGDSQQIDNNLGERRLQRCAVVSISCHRPYSSWVDSINFPIGVDASDDEPTGPRSPGLLDREVQKCKSHLRGPPVFRDQAQQRGRVLGVLGRTGVGWHEEVKTQRGALRCLFNVALVVLS